MLLRGVPAGVQAFCRGSGFTVGVPEHCAFTKALRLAKVELMQDKVPHMLGPNFPQGTVYAKIFCISVPVHPVVTNKDVCR